MNHTFAKPALLRSVVSLVLISSIAGTADSQGPPPGYGGLKEAFPGLQVIDPVTGQVSGVVPQRSQAINAATANAAAANSNDPKAKAEQRKKERTEAINRMVFDRRPSAILKLWSERALKAKADAERAQQQAATEPKSETPTPKPTDAPEVKPDAPKVDAPPATTPGEPAAAKPAEPSTNPPADMPNKEGQEGQPDKGTTTSGDGGAEKPTPEQEAAAKAKADAARADAEAKAQAEADAKERKSFDELMKLIPEAVTLGEWELFGKTLADRERLSEIESVAIYDRMLEQLAAQLPMDFSQVAGMSKEMQQFMQTTLNNQRNNTGQRFQEKQSLSFADLIAMIRATPVELKDEQVEKVARLLRLVIVAGNQLNDFVASLKNEGDKLLSRNKAALLLSAAGQDAVTMDFLPTMQDAIDKKDRQGLNLLARHYLALYQKDRKEVDREEAWKVTMAALDLPTLAPAETVAEKTPASTPPVDPNAPQSTAAEKAKQSLVETNRRAIDTNQRSEALTRAVSLAPQMRDELGKTWLNESFTKFPERGQEILAKIGTATSQLLAQTPQDEANRTRNLELQRTAVSQFFATKPTLDSNWQGILNLLATNWLQEAQVSRQFSRDSQFGPSMRRDAFGNIYYLNPNEDMGDEMQSMPMQMGMVAPIKINKVLETAPSGEWFDAIDASIRPQFTMTLCRLWLKVNEDAKAFPYIEQLVTTHPDTALELAEEFLRVWTSNHNPNEAKQRTNYYMFVYGYEQKADKIPLTRSKQERNLQELSGWLERLRPLPFKGSLNEELLVKAFMTSHSVAEVYDIEDIEKVFGTWGKIEAATMASLIQQMRTNLAGIWRDPNTQRDAKTNRKKTDIQAEVTRGYQVATKVLNRSLERYPDDWQLLLVKACIMHDENDFLQEVAPSSEFSEHRLAAFEVYSKAADAYVKIAPSLPERLHRNDVFDYWFYASLGAADLKGISEKNRPDSHQIPLIANALGALTGDIGTKHRDRFANALFTRMSAVSPSCKFRYVEAGFKLVGENPQASEALKVYNYYKDLVKEIQLVTRVDGDARVGQEPFGVYVDLLHSTEIERESGGFSKYLQNQNNGQVAVYNYGRPAENYRDKFQDSVKLTLQEQFEVLSVTFNHPESKSIAADVPGWRTTPYAYLLLKARGPEVDKLPAIKMDMDFLDTSGYVVLPMSSGPIPLDAKEQADALEAKNVKMVQILDERQSAKGQLVVETRVTASGLIPALKTLLDTSVAGFDLASAEDSGTSVIEFDKESVKPSVLTERTWTMKFTAADPAAPTPKSFAFPEPRVEMKEVSYQRYVDADLKTVEATVPLVEEYGSSQRAWTIVGLSAVVGVLLLTALGLFLRHLSVKPVEATHVVQVADTPFALLTRLQSVEKTPALSQEKRSRLREDIATLEQYYFAENRNGHAQPDLLAMSNRWR